MDKLLSAEYWSQQWPLLFPLMLLSMALGWWLRGAVVKGEIASLEKTNDTLKQRLELAQEKEAASKPAAASLQAELVEINAQDRKA
jgi:hypothetical protein